MTLRASLVWLLCGVLVLLAGCATDSRYTLSQDAPPDTDVDVSALRSPTPRLEPYSRGGNGPTYEVWGKTYRVLADHRGYVATGRASWYGKKFHGHATSNGETFDMFALTAAHRSLPLPSYVQVTNLDNGRQAIVRVNDRGPFHSDRIIDLSYAAAKKLGFAGRGTAPVRVAAITVTPGGDWFVAGSESAPEPSPSAGVGLPGELFVQVAAFNDADLAARLARQVEQVTTHPVRVMRGRSQGSLWHRVRVGPFRETPLAEQVLQRLAGRNLGNPVLVTQKPGTAN